MKRQLGLLGCVLVLGAVVLAGLLLTAQPAPAAIPLYTTTCSTYSSADTPVNIPDGEPAGATSWITVTNQSGIVQSLTLTMTLTHTWMSDLLVSFVDPNAASNILSNGFGDANAGFVNTHLDNDAATTLYNGTYPYTGTYRPYEAFTFGQSGNGTWGLHAQDRYGGDSGTIDSWTLELCTSTDPTATPTRAFRSSSRSSSA